MNVLKNFVIIGIKSNHQAIFAAWLHWNLASSQTSLCTFSLKRSGHKILKSVIVLLSTYQTSCVQQMYPKCEAVDNLSVDCEQW